MRTQWWWNQTFESLMETLGAWIKEHPNITLVNVDWKYVIGAGGSSGYWYLLMFYKD